MHKAIGMLSGGLDSLLAAKIMKDEGFEVIALHFYTGFNGKTAEEISLGPDWKWSPSEHVVSSAEKLGITLRPINVMDEYLDVITHPRYSYGSGANPCIDCRIFLLNKAREIMESEHADFVFSGEVLGQRPLSQHRGALNLVESKAGLIGRLLRPLSAQLLTPTIPEEKGIVNRDHLYGFNGRSRKPQMKLAEQFGIDWYPDPAGGCILTEKSFAHRYFDLVDHQKDHAVTLRALNTLKTGRHLRLKSGLKVIMGRNEIENEYFQKLLGCDFWRFEPKDFPGPLAYALGEPTDDDIAAIAAICTRYGKARTEERVAVMVEKGEEKREVLIAPAENQDIEPLLVH